MASLRRPRPRIHPKAAEGPRRRRNLPPRLRRRPRSLCHRRAARLTRRRALHCHLAAGLLGHPERHPLSPPSRRILQSRRTLLGRLARPRPQEQKLRPPRFLPWLRPVVPQPHPPPPAERTGSRPLHRQLARRRRLPGPPHPLPRASHQSPESKRRIRKEGPTIAAVPRALARHSTAVTVDARKLRQRRFQTLRVSPRATESRCSRGFSRQSQSLAAPDVVPRQYGDVAPTLAPSQRARGPARPTTLTAADSRGARRLPSPRRSARGRDRNTWARSRPLSTWSNRPPGRRLCDAT
jgi:hypothetical protein